MMVCESVQHQLPCADGKQAVVLYCLHLFAEQPCIPWVGKGSQQATIGPWHPPRGFTGKSLVTGAIPKAVLQSDTVSKSFTSRDTLQKRLCPVSEQTTAWNTGRCYAAATQGTYNPRVVAHFGILGKINCLIESPVPAKV